MSQFSEEPWSTNPNAPRIPYRLYFAEKANFAGTLIAAIFYGIVIVLFFQCTGAMFDPVNRVRGGIRWGLVAYTAAMFSFVTIFITMMLWAQSVCYIDNREYPGSSVSLPGPLGYLLHSYSKAPSVTVGVTLLLNNWLADGFLLYRCYIIYAKNYWVIAFPCLMYLASVAMGIVFFRQVWQPDSILRNAAAIYNFGIPYFSISLSLNVLLTLMIVTRLILHSRSMRKCMGTPAGTSGWYETIVTLLVESCALYVVGLLLYIGPWRSYDFAQYIFFPLLADIQVIAPFLIILRVVNRKAFETNTPISGNNGSIHFRTPGKSTNGAGTLLDGHPESSVDGCGTASGEPIFGVMETTNLQHDAV